MKVEQEAGLTSGVTLNHLYRTVVFISRYRLLECLRKGPLHAFVQRRSVVQHRNFADCCL